MSSTRPVALLVHHSASLPVHQIIGLSNHRPAGPSTHRLVNISPSTHRPPSCCWRPSAPGQPTSSGIYGLGQRERKEGSADGGCGKSLRDTEMRVRETDSGRRRHRGSISCLWTESAVCQQPSSSFTFSLSWRVALLSCLALAIMTVTIWLETLN